MNSMHLCRPIVLAVACVLSASIAAAATTQTRYDPGASASEIKIGQTMPYSGPVTAAAAIGKAEAAYFNMVNDRGGVNGRKIKFFSLDDGYNPARTVEQTRKLVEQEQVLLIFGSLGTANNSVIQRYLNTKQVPHLLIAAIGLRWNDPKNFPWSMSLTASPLVEMEAFSRYLLRRRPNARIAVLYQNDDLGKDYLKATKETLGDKAPTMIVAEASYEVTDPSVDSQIVALKASGADTFLAFTTPKFGAFSIRKTYDIGWRPMQFVAFPSTSVATVLTPAGLDKSVGLLAAQYTKDPMDPAWQNDAEMREYVSWMKRYNPDGDVADSLNITGYISAALMVEILRRCGDDLTRANVMHQATSLQDVKVPMLLPGISVTTSPSDYRPIKQTHLRRFDGQRWARVED
jgi:ABC-type branched-subunit amino acid transport system substrate-binding protein